MLSDRIAQAGTARVLRADSTKQGMEEEAGQPLTGQPIASSQFHAVFLAMCTLLLLGGLADGYAHTRLNLTSFFSWPHAIIYSALATIAVLLVLAARRNRAGGSRWRDALPAGYNLAAIGLGLFGASGAVDLAWHAAFGLEGSTETLLSPPHLLLAGALLLIVTAPARAAGEQAVGVLESWGAATRVVLCSLVLASTIVFFFLQWSNPVVDVAAGSVDPDSPDVLAGLRATQGLVATGSDPRMRQGIASFIIYSSVVSGMLLSVIRRRAWPRWFVAVLFVVPNGLLTLFDFQLRFLPLVLAVGVATDLYVQRFRPSTARTAAYRAFGAGVPLLFAAGYLLTVRLTDGQLGWTAPTAAGAVALAGLTGAAVSCLMVDPNAAPSTSSANRAFAD